MKLLHFTGNDGLALLQAARSLKGAERSSAEFYIRRVLHKALGVNLNTLLTGAVLYVDCDGRRVLKLVQSAAALEIESLLP